MLRKAELPRPPTARQRLLLYATATAAVTDGDGSGGGGDVDAAALVGTISAYATSAAAAFPLCASLSGFTAASALHQPESGQMVGSAVLATSAGPDAVMAADGDGSHHDSAAADSKAASMSTSTAAGPPSPLAGRLREAYAAADAAFASADAGAEDSSDGGAPSGRVALAGLDEAGFGHGLAALWDLVHVSRTNTAALTRSPSSRTLSTRSRGVLISALSYFGCFLRLPAI